MAGIFKKVASAFVEFQPGEEAARQAQSPRADADLDAITANASDLLAQLGDQPGAAPGTQTPAPASSSRMSMTADDVFAGAGLADGPNSARRLLKMIAGLSAFPPPQQVAMVRALDAADETWSEPEVLADARTRQTALRHHLTAVEAEKNERIRSIQAKSQQVQSEGQATIAEIDKQVAELQKMRQEAVSQIAIAVASLEAEAKDVETAAEKARTGIQGVIGALQGLLTFFGADVPTPPTKPA